MKGTALPFEDKIDEYMRWTNIFTVLSLDIATRFLPDMGLGFQLTIELKEIARKYVQLTRHTVPSLSESIPDVLRRLGNIDALHGELIYKWGKSTIDFHLLKSQALPIWIVLLQILTRKYASDVNLEPINLPQNKLILIENIVQKYINKKRAFKLRLNEAQNETPSIWDLSIYSTYYKGCSPLDWINLQTSFVTNKSQMQEIYSELNSNELQQLREWAMKQCEMMGEIYNLALIKSELKPN